MADRFRRRASLNDSPRVSRRWDDGSSGVWSLLDVIQVYAHLYLEMGRSLQYWMTGPYCGSAGHDPLIPIDAQNRFRTDMNDLQAHAKQLNLRVVRELLAKYGQVVGEKPITGQAARDIAGEVQRAASAELKSRLFFVMATGNDAYWPEDKGERICIFGPDVEDQFAEAVNDMDEACRCASFQLYTACVFHLMRITESGLKKLANKLGIPYAPSWESYIKQIGSNIDKDWKDKSSEWKSDEPFSRVRFGTCQAICVNGFSFYLGIELHRLWAKRRAVG